jgi:D-arabinose 1-dehydrogenase-like Zn-dependent alcohol dehydrogenase
MNGVSPSIREFVRSRAKTRCEYCQTAQEISGAQMHIEHIIPLSQSGTSEKENLCLSCAWCNSHKWVKSEAVDPLTDEMIPLYNPRTQEWQEHFRWSNDGVTIIGITAIGRATVDVLKMNNEYIVTARRHWVEAGWHPPT